MNSKIISNEEKTKLAKIKASFENIKSNVILKKIFNYIKRCKSLIIIKFNKKLQNRLNFNINDYDEYSKIEIELKILGNKSGRFINIPDEEKKYYHIYFDNSKKKIKKYNLTFFDKVKTIKIIIDYQVKSLKKLFYCCDCINSIIFKKFCRSRINDMSLMFYKCSSLIELNLNNFNTNNVTNMSQMFYKCSSLKEINLSNFNTINVTNMSGMFDGCSSLLELNLTNFNTNNVTHMIWMFNGCPDILIKKIKKQNKNLIII